MAGFIAVHTGAGNCINELKYKKACKESCLKAISILKAGGTALDACEAAIVSLEDCEYTNAGFGSNLTWDGKVECEASIMDGSSLQFGACTNLTNIGNPISLARLLCERQSKLLTLERIPPMVLSGEGASNYAKELNIPLVDHDALVSKKAVKKHEHFRKNVTAYENTFNVKVTPLDTVGAICVDNEGNCVAGCSSGGLILKIPGRVGQAATYGAGCWAMKQKDKSAATCTTGNGEYLMKTLLAREIVTGLFNDDCPILSLHKTFKNSFLESPFLANLGEVYGGALSLTYDSESGDGEVIWSHTTKSFCIGHMTTGQKTPKFVYSTLPSNVNQGTATVVQGQHFKIPI